MKKYILSILLPLIAVILIPTQLQANIGKITILKGDVTIKRDGKIKKAKNGTTLEKSDFIKTAKNGKVQIIFTDKTIFTIGKNSTLDIADYLYDESKPSKNKAKFNVLKGAFTSITGRIGKLNRSKFKLKTKSASIGIRGTIVKANQEVVMCTQGAITVTTLSGASINIDAGTKTDVSSGIPTPAENITSDDEELMDADITEEDREESDKEDEQSNDEVAQEETEEETQESTEQVGTTDTQSEQNSDNISEGIDDNTGVNTPIGYSMKSGVSSSTLNVTIDGNNVTTSDGTVLETKDSSYDGVTSWGYWGDGSGGIDHREVWISGVKTQVNVINQLRDKNPTATYSGKVIGSVEDKNDNSFESIVDNDNNSVKLNFDLGGGSNNFDGNINFDTSDGQEWRSTIGTGTGTNNTFSSSSVSGEGSDGRAIRAGEIEGSFYGSDAQQVGGTFSLETGNINEQGAVDANDGHTASGVFKATK